MRVTPSIVAIGLAPFVALGGCEDPAAGPGLEAMNPAYNVASPTPAGKAGPDRPGPRGPAEILALSDALDLSHEQRVAIEAIALELQERSAPLWAELRSDGPGSAGPPQGGPGSRIDTENPTMQTIRDNTNAAMRKALVLLTKEQARLFAELRAEQGDVQFRSPAPPPSFQPGAIILDAADALALSQAQMDELRAIFARGLSGPEAIGAVEAVLTADQLESLRSMLRDRRNRAPGPWTS